MRSEHAFVEARAQFPVLERTAYLNAGSMGPLSRATVEAMRSELDANLVDGAQSVGAIPVDSRGLDYLTISGQKWLCGPDSTGALVVADPERLRVARPSYFSRQEHDPDGSFVPWPGARRFEHGWIAT